MPTLHENLQKFYAAGKKELTKKEKSILGKKIVSKWNLQKLNGIIPNDVRYTKQKVTEDGTGMKVNHYPENFIQSMDDVIEKYYRKISLPPVEIKPVKKIRKRIPLKPKNVL